MGSLSIWHWLIVLGIVVLVFGTKKLSSMGTDVGSAIRNFKKAMNDGEKDENAKQIKHMEGSTDFGADKQNAKSDPNSNRP